MSRTKPSSQPFQVVEKHLNETLPPTAEATAGIASVGVKMSLRVCSECGVVHALPAELLIALAKREDGRLFCPNGHATAVESNLFNGRDLVTKYVRSLAELRESESHVARLHLQLASLTSPQAQADIDKAELARRLTAMDNRARDVGGHRVCEICGGRYFGPARYRRHLKYAHVDQIKALPSSHFD